MRPQGSHREQRRLRRSWFGWVIVAGLILSACAQDYPQSALDPAGPIARQQDNLWNLVFVIAIVVFVLVQGAIIYALFRFRERKDDDGQIPKQVAGNTKLEILWTAIPALILVGVAIPTVQTIFELAGRPDGDPLEVRVVGKQYFWEFEYTGDEGQGVITATELHIPTDRPVYLTMESRSAVVTDTGAGAEGEARNGVIHSFWVPRLAGKQDVVAGHVRELTIQADEPGRYPGACAEFCGLSHARMRFYVEAQEPAEFEDWLADQAEPAVADFDTELAAEGERLVSSDTIGQQCIACHAIDGYDTEGEQVANQRIGPNLTHFASRETFAGGFLPINEENVQAWLDNPQALKPGAQMPRLGLTPDQIDAITAYLLSLE